MGLPGVQYEFGPAPLPFLQIGFFLPAEHPRVFAESVVRGVLSEVPGRHAGRAQRLKRGSGPLEGGPGGALNGENETGDAVSGSAQGVQSLGGVEQKLQVPDHAARKRRRLADVEGRGGDQRRVTVMDSGEIDEGNQRQETQDL